MISTVSIRNLHLDAVSELLEDGNSECEYLIIAHQDLVLESCLERVFADCKAALYQVPQQCWEMENEDLAEAIQWAVEIAKVGKVIVVGCSSASLPKEDSDRAVRIWDPNSSTPALLDRTRDAVLSRRRAQDHFVDQLQVLLAYSELSDHIQKGDLKIEGLFYRAESGVFTCFDEKTNAYPVLN